MATVTLQSGMAPITTNAASYAPPAFTPPAGVLLVVQVSTCAALPAGAESVSSTTGLTFTKVATHLYATGNLRASIFVADALSTNVSQTVTYNAPGTTFGGGQCQVYSIDIGRVGLAAVVQYGTGIGPTNQTGTGIALGQAADPGNPWVAAWAGDNGGTPYNFNPAWTNDNAGTHNSPTARYQGSRIDSGITGTNIALASYNATRYVLAVEFNAAPMGPVGTLTSTENTEALDATATVTDPPARSATLASTEGLEAVTSSVKALADRAVTGTSPENTEALTSSVTVTNPPARSATLSSTEGVESTTTEIDGLIAASLNSTEGKEALDGTASVLSGPPALATLDSLEGTESLTSAATVTDPPARSATLNSTEGLEALTSAVQAPFSPTSTFTEDYESGINATKWDAYGLNGGTIAFTGGEVVHNTTTNVVAGESTALSRQHFSLLNSSLYIKLVQPLRVAGNANGIDTGFGLQSPTGGKTILWFLESTGALKIGTQNNWAMTVLKTETTDYYNNANTYTWLRIRETAGTTYWESAPITASNPPIESDWVVRHSVLTSSLPVVPSEMIIRTYVYQNVAVGIPTQPSKFDGLNTAANGAVTSVNGSLVSIEGVESLTSAATVTNPPSRSADLSSTEGTEALTSAATGAPNPRLSSTENIEALTSAVTVTNPPARAATLNATEGADSTTTEVDAPVIFAMTPGLESVEALTSAVTVTNPPARSATLSATEGLEALTGNATVTNPGELLASLDAVENTEALTSSVTVTGVSSSSAALDAVEGADTLTSSVTVSWPPVSAALDRTENVEALTSAVTVTNPPARSATLASAEGADSTNTEVDAFVAVTLARTEGTEALTSAATVVNPPARSAGLNAVENTEALTAFAYSQPISTDEILVELGPSTEANNGSFNYRFASFGNFNVKGTAPKVDATFGAVLPGDPYVLTGAANLGGSIALARSNGSETETDNGVTGGVFGNYPIYVGRRADNTMAFKGRLYQLIIRGAYSSPGEVVSIEQYVGSKTGVALNVRGLEEGTPVTMRTDANYTFISPNVIFAWAMFLMLAIILAGCAAVIAGCGWTPSGHRVACTPSMGMVPAIQKWAVQPKQLVVIKARPFKIILRNQGDQYAGN